MSLLQNKMPVSLLHEMCTKMSMPATCTVAPSVPGDKHFVVNFTVGKISISGSGLSKKKAKHNAALAMIRELIIQDPDYRFTPKSEIDAMLECGDDKEGTEINEINYIGQIQEIFQKQSLPQPEYKYHEQLSTPMLMGGDGGPPITGKHFVCTVKYGDLEMVGRAKSKKVSKQNAAMTLYKHLQKRKGQPLGSQSTAETAGDCKPSPHKPRALRTKDILRRFDEINLAADPLLLKFNRMRLCSVYPYDRVIHKSALERERLSIEARRRQNGGSHGKEEEQQQKEQEQEQEQQELDEKARSRMYAGDEAAYQHAYNEITNGSPMMHQKYLEEFLLAKDFKFEYIETGGPVKEGEKYMLMLIVHAECEIAMPGMGSTMSLAKDNASFNCLGFMQTMYSQRKSLIDDHFIRCSDCSRAGRVICECSDDDDDDEEANGGISMFRY